MNNNYSSNNNQKSKHQFIRPNNIEELPGEGASKSLIRLEKLDNKKITQKLKQQ